MNLNTSNWKYFKVKDLFRLEPTKGVTTEDLEFGEDVPYIAAKHDTNGLMQMCKKEGFENWISKGNCIVFVLLGAGSAGYANYLADDFIGMNGKTCCGYIDGVLNKEIGVFLETILCQERPKYNYGRSWTGDRLKETVIALPIQKYEDGTPKIDNSHKYSSDGYIPDWNFMENYIQTLHYKPLTTKNKQGIVPNLNVNDWKEFSLNSVFTLKGGYYNKKPEHSIEGQIPFLASTESNNGVTEYYSLDDVCQWDKVGGEDFTLDKKIYDGNCIAVTVNGSVCNAFYQGDDFTCSHDITALYLKGYKLNVYLAEFLCTIIMQDKYRWSYGRKPHDVKKFGKSIIKLPVVRNMDGTIYIDAESKYSIEGFVPDWIFMENYIKSLPYGDRI